MLAAILATVRESRRPMCVADLSAVLGIEASVLEGMLETLVRRGRLRALELAADGCDTCPLRGGCFVIDAGLAKTYVLPPDPATTERRTAALS